MNPIRILAPHFLVHFIIDLNLHQGLPSRFHDKIVYLFRIALVYANVSAHVIHLDPITLKR
jgi:hypothetical protein